MSRNTTIDGMRLLGLMLIILAHVNPPNLLFQLRTFDVPMMVFISGMSFYVSKKKDFNIRQYIFSRFKRLVLPVWFFLSMFFTVIYFLKPQGFENLLSLKMIVSTYLLNGFGYVWIIRVFLIIAVLSPLYVLVSKNLSGYGKSMLALAMLIVSTLMAKSNIEEHGKLIAHIMNDIIYPAISYGAIFIIGFSYLNFKNKEKIFTFFIFFATVAAYCLYNYIVKGMIHGPQHYKYPPTLFYIAYAVVMILPLYFIFDLILKKQKLPYILSFISSNTIWIYLWHIPVVEYFYRCNPSVNCIIKYTITISFAILISYFQVTIIKKHFNDNKLIKTIFTG